MLSDEGINHDNKFQVGVPSHNSTPQHTTHYFFCIFLLFKYIYTSLQYVFAQFIVFVCAKSESKRVSRES